MTTEKKSIPWATDYLNEWCKILRLQDWDIEIEITEHGDDSVMADVHVMPDIRWAKISLSSDVPETLDGLDTAEIEKWQHVIIHELVHVFIGRLTDFIERDLLTELSIQANQLARRTLIREVEPIVDLMAYVLHGLKHGDK